MALPAVLLLALAAVLVVLGESVAFVDRQDYRAEPLSSVGADRRRRSPPPLPPSVLRKLLGGGTGGRGSTVLLVGPCEGGKTTMWHQLLQGSTHLGTVASMQPNVGEGPLAGEKVGADGGRWYMDG